MMTRASAIALANRWRTASLGCLATDEPAEWVVRAIQQADEHASGQVGIDLAAMRQATQELTGVMLAYTYTGDPDAWRKQMMQGIVTTLKEYGEYVTKLEARHDFLCSIVIGVPLLFVAASYLLAWWRL